MRDRDRRFLIELVSRPEGWEAVTTDYRLGAVKIHAVAGKTRGWALKEAGKAITKHLKKEK